MTRRLDHSARIDVGEPFRSLTPRFVELLRGLSEDAWSKPTAVPGRTVKDLVAHLLHGSLRRMSGMRDGYQGSTPEIRSNDDLVAFIQADNRRFMDGVAGLSPQLLVEQIERYDPMVVNLFEGVDPQTPGLPVSWAGDEHSPHWFDWAREYTEKWHHQQQIRDAVGAEGLYDAPTFGPVLETFARGLPHAVRDVPGSRARVRTTGVLERSWVLVKDADGWALFEDDGGDVTREVAGPAETLWKPWTCSARAADVRRDIQGDEALADAVAGMVVVMARGR